MSEQQLDDLYNQVKNKDNERNKLKSILKPASLEADYTAEDDNDDERFVN